MNAPDIAHLLDTLNATHGQPGQLWFAAGPGGLPFIHIHNAHAQAHMSLYGGQVLSFRPYTQTDLLFLSDKALFQSGKAIRGGVPVCWPWFGRHPSESGWPSHGWARLSDWQLLDSEMDEQGVRLTWQLALCDWQVTLQAELGDTMKLRLRTSHQDSEPCQLSHALHAYWRISDVARVALLGLDGAEGHDLLARADCRQHGELRIEDGCHRIFRRSGVLQLQDLAWQRRLLIDTGGANSVVWHPGSRPLTDVGWNEALGFLCVEAASCGADSLCLKPGEEALLELKARLG